MEPGDVPARAGPRDRRRRSRDRVGGDEFKPGDRVGVGCFVDSCGDCDECRAGEEQYCTNDDTVWTYDSIGRDGKSTEGGYSTAITVEQDYICRIPDALKLDVAAPLLCAGITFMRRHVGVRGA